MKRVFTGIIIVCAALILSPTIGMGAYSHGETDSPNFLTVYPDKSGSKLNSCELCHTGTNNSPVGTCNWCHTRYGYSGTGNITATLNAYGKAFLAAGRSAAAIEAIKSADSDGDGYTNDAEIKANSFPGYAGDMPGMKTAPSKVYTMAQIEALPQHEQFMLMNTTKQVDSYGKYSGVSIKALLDDAGIDLTRAQSISVYSLDGYSAYYPLYPQADDVTDPAKPYIFYHVYGNMTGQTYQYPQALYWYKPTADKASGGWCDYSAPSCVGLTNGLPLVVEGGLKALLATKYEGAYLVKGAVNRTTGKLDGEGPFRLVVPQKYAEKGWPDLQSTAQNAAEEWNYDPLLDHNAGMCAKSAIVIRVDPLPEGTTDINTNEAFDTYANDQKIIIYGAIADSNDETKGEETAGSDGSSDKWCFMTAVSGACGTPMLPAVLGFFLVSLAAAMRARSNKPE